MPDVTRTEIWPASMEKIYDVVVDYPAYPRFLNEVLEAEVLQSSGDGAQVRFLLDLAKSVGYILNYVYERPRRVDWSLESGDFFKRNSGYWKLEPLDEGTRVTYSMEVDFRGFVPKFVVKGLINRNFPGMMGAFRREALR